MTKPVEGLVHWLWATKEDDVNLRQSCQIDLDIIYTHLKYMLQLVICEENSNHILLRILELFFFF